VGGWGALSPLNPPSCRSCSLWKSALQVPFSLTLSLLAHLVVVFF